ncbi:restriction endonuclease [Candidatus Giovannonibacteria bacterium]|nr:restriction endonuclease [Candidatus Giovannonibacteria bacterium]
MTYLENYLKRVATQSPALEVSLRRSADEFTKKHVDTFDFNSHASGLLYGHVQSGKTGQMLAIASAAADKGFKFFILVTTDNVILHKQTLERAKAALGGFIAGFNVLGEMDEQAFLTRGLQMPTMLVLKKNASVLKTWSNNIDSNPIYKDEPLFILDDEADASSLNTKINQKDQSAINRLLEKINSQAPSSIYLHVTATPQSLVLQVSQSLWKPEYSFYLPPGKGYLGGDFFYGDESKCAIETEDNERDDLLKAEHVPIGLRKAALHFLVAASDLFLTKEKPVCTMLIHPGTRISEHSTVSTKIEKFLEGVKNDLIANSATLEFDLRDAWEEFSKTKASIKSFDEIMQFLRSDMPIISIIVLNSNTPDGAVYDKGLNIVIGGNTLGRGVTFPGLQVVYYCRSSKKPQADTYWQHARIFGYDRDSGLCRIFSPRPLIKLFKELNDANNALFETLRQKGPQAVSILTPAGTRPTRANVVLKDDLMVVAGNVNYFPMLPTDAGLKKLDAELGTSDDERDIPLAEAEKLLNSVTIEKNDLWYQHSFADCVRSLKKHAKYQCKLIIRTNRSISKGTRTLLSPPDRELASHYNNQLVLIMYRLNGETEKGWNGRPLWVPNIKFPEGTYFYYQMK